MTSYFMYNGKPFPTEGNAQRTREMLMALTILLSKMRKGDSTMSQLNCIHVLYEHMK